MVSGTSRTSDAQQQGRQRAAAALRAASLGEVAHRATGHRRRWIDPAALLRDRRRSGDLADRPRPTAAHRSTLHRLCERGARATLDAVATPTHTTTNHSR